MELMAGIDTQIFVIFLGVVVALGCTLVAFLVDYLKGKNERLREQVLEMTVRQEERARLPQTAVDSTAVITAIAQVGKNLEAVVRTALRADEPRADEPRAAGSGDGEVRGTASPARESEQEPEPTLEPNVGASPVYQARRQSAEVKSSLEDALPVVPAEVSAEVSAETQSPDLPVVEPAAAESEPVVTDPLATEPDWRQASWHSEVPVGTVEPEPEVVADLAVDEPVVTTEPVGETLRSLFETPHSIAKAAQLEMQRHLDEPIAEAPEMVAPEAGALEPEAGEASEEPVVRIRVLNNSAATPVDEPAEAMAEVMPEPVIEQPVVEQPIAEAVAEPVAEEVPYDAPEELAEVASAEADELVPVAAAVDFLTEADLGEVKAPEPLESMDSLMAAVNGENEAPVETEAPVEPEEPGVLVMPSGMNDRATLDFLKRDKALFTGLIVSIGINDYARLQETSGRPAAEELAKSVNQLVKSLITAPNGSEFFGCRSADDEFVLVFANESGSVAQRRLNGLSERLWDFQLRSLGNFSVMFSWGATEANGETFEDAVEAASERMRETRQNRRTISMEKTRLKKVG